MEHILHQLLSSASTVILPHFGAIIKLGENYQFNEFLKYNDGKLITAIEEAKGISKDDATEVVSDYIRSIKEHLNANKKFDLGEVGYLTKKADKVIIVSNEKSVTAKASAPKSVVNKTVTPPVAKEELLPTPTPIVKEAVVKKEAEKEELPKAYTSTNLVIDKAIEKIKTVKTVAELTAFAKGETREKVLNAIHLAKEALTEPKTIEKPKVEKKQAVVPKVEAINTTPPVEKTQDKTTIKAEDKVETKPITEELKPQPVAVPKEEKKQKEKEVKKEIVQPTAEALAIAKSKDEQIEKELMAGAIVIEKEVKKRKRNRLLLWVAILFLVIGSSIIGYLKKNEILALINKTEIAENKELINPKKVEKETPTTTEEINTEEEVQPIEEEAILEEQAEEIEVEAPQEKAPKEESKPATKAKIVEQVQAVVSGSYTIIVGSFSEKDNADGLVEKLKAEGFTNAQNLGKYGGLYAVSIDRFDSRQAASAAVDQYKEKGHSGWVKKV